MTAIANVRRPPRLTLGFATAVCLHFVFVHAGCGASPESKLLLVCICAANLHRNSTDYVEDVRSVRIELAAESAVKPRS